MGRPNDSSIHESQPRKIAASLNFRQKNIELDLDRDQGAGDVLGERPGLRLTPPTRGRDRSPDDQRELSSMPGPRTRRSSPQISLPVFHAAYLRWNGAWASIVSESPSALRVSVEHLSCSRAFEADRGSVLAQAAGVTVRHSG